MVKYTNSIGSVTFTSDFFASLVGKISTTCYGVSGMATSGPMEGFRSLIFGNDFPEKGVRVSANDGKLDIELHIRVIYGVNLNAIVDSISNKVKYAVENATGFIVHKVDVFVDEMVSE